MKTSSGRRQQTVAAMFLLDTNVISEARKGNRADPGVRAFFTEIAQKQAPIYLSAITVGELRRGIDLIRHRGETIQAQRLEDRLSTVLNDYGESVRASMQTRPSCGAGCGSLLLNMPSISRSRRLRCCTI